GILSFSYSRIPSPWTAVPWVFHQHTSHTRPAVDEAAAKRHLVCHTGQAVAGGRLRQAGDLEQDHARLDDGGPVLRLALALAHARLGGDRGNRLMREHADVQPAL